MLLNRFYIRFENLIINKRENYILSDSSEIITEENLLFFVTDVIIL
ncbi:MAG: hypothetical protein LBM96_07255 [Methanobrevibacter sp.]|nr:hypothetical protein [Candidatus Methanoflexus mossambicus]